LQAELSRAKAVIESAKVLDPHSHFRDDFSDRLKSPTLALYKEKVGEPIWINQFSDLTRYRAYNDFMIAFAKIFVNAQQFWGIASDIGLTAVTIQQHFVTLSDRNFAPSPTDSTEEILVKMWRLNPPAAAATSSFTAVANAKKATKKRPNGMQSPTFQKGASSAKKKKTAAHRSRGFTEGRHALVMWAKNDFHKVKITRIIDKEWADRTHYECKFADGKIGTCMNSDDHPVAIDGDCGAVRIVVE
jgi:hypothetical protein